MKYKLALLCVISLLLLQYCNSVDRKSSMPMQDMANPDLTKYVGKKFAMKGFTDMAGSPAKLDLNKAPLTLIDIWFGACPSCIAEMKEYKDILKGKEKQISVVSISINTFPEWKKISTDVSGQFNFLKESVPNWQQLIFTSASPVPEKNSLSGDRLQELQQNWTTHTFPVIFVVNKEGIIQDVPVSAVNYIKNL